MKIKYIITYETSSKSSEIIEGREKMLFMLIETLNIRGGLAGSLDKSKTHKFSIKKEQ